MAVINFDVALGTAPENGASVYAWKMSRFPGGVVPAENGAAPAGSPDAGPVVTDRSYGYEGAGNITVPTFEPYGLQVVVGGSTGWKGPCQPVSTAPFFNATDYGAKGVGTDDTTAIQAAFTDALAVGGTVYLPKGNYLVSNLTFNVPTGTAATIRGEGGGQSKLTVKTGTTGTVLNVNCPGIASIALVGFKMECSNAPTVTAVALTNTVLANVSDVQIYDCAIGIDTVTSSTMRFTDVIVGNPTTAGIRVQGDGGLEDYFTRVRIYGQTGATLADGIRINRTTTTDVGALFMNDVEVTAGTGTVNYGLNIQCPVGSGNTTNLFAKGLIFDGCSTNCIWFNNTTSAVVSDSWLTTIGSIYAVRISNGAVHKFINCVVGSSGCAGAFDLSDGSLNDTFIGNFMPYGNAFHVAVAHAPVGISFSDNYIGTLTDDPATLASGYSTADSSGIRAHGGSAIVVADDTAAAATPTKAFRVSGGALQILNDAYNAVIASLTDTGGFTASGYLSASIAYLSSIGKAGGSTTPLTFTESGGVATTTVSGYLAPQQHATAGAPAYVKGAIYFDTTLNKLRIGGATAWETVTSV